MSTADIVDQEAEIARLRDQLRAMQEDNSALREAATSQLPTDVEGDGSGHRGSQHRDAIVEG
eukprot:3749837-Pyramimonas_sp.AAC.1